MKEIKQLYFEVKKKMRKLLGITGGTIWFDNDDPDEIDALSTLAIKEAGFKRSDFFKPVRVDHLVVDDMPEEGVFDTAFCDRYKLAEDGKSWLLPAAQSDPPNVLEGELLQPLSDKGMLIRFLAQWKEDDCVTHVTAERYKELLAQTMDLTGYLGDIALSITIDSVKEQINNLDIQTLHQLVRAIGTVFPDEKRPGIVMTTDFCCAWLDTEDTFREQLVKEWCAGNRVSCIGEGADVTQTGDITPDEADGPDGLGYNVNGEPMAEVMKKMDWPVVEMSLPMRWMAQMGKGTKALHLSPEEYGHVMAMTGPQNDDEAPLLNSINLMLQHELAPEIDKLDLYHLHRLVMAVEQIAEKDSCMAPHLLSCFVRVWLDTEYSDQDTLVKAWCEGKRIPRTGNNPATDEVPEPQKNKVAETGRATRPRRSEKPTFKTINYELGCGFYDDLDFDNLRPAMDFAKRIIAEDREDWKRMSITAGVISSIKDYDRQTIIDMVRRAPKAVHGDNPELRRTWCESFLAVHGVRDPDWYEHVTDTAPTTHEENTTRLRQAGKCLRDIEAGRFQSEEIPHPADVPADNPSATETMEPDATESRQNPQSLDAQSPVDPREAEYQEKLSDIDEARRNIPLKNPVDTSNETASVRDKHAEGVTLPHYLQWALPDGRALTRGESAESPPPDNDDRAAKQPEEHRSVRESQDASVPKPLMDSSPETILYLQEANETLRQILASQLRTEKNHRKNAAIIRGMLAMMYDAETEKETTHDE